MDELRRPCSEVLSRLWGDRQTRRPARSATRLIWTSNCLWRLSERSSHSPAVDEIKNIFRSQAADRS